MVGQRNLQSVGVDGFLYIIDCTRVLDVIVIHGYLFMWLYPWIHCSFINFCRCLIIFIRLSVLVSLRLYKWQSMDNTLKIAVKTFNVWCWDYNIVCFHFQTIYTHRSLVHRHGFVHLYLALSKFYKGLIMYCSVIPISFVMHMVAATRTKVGTYIIHIILSVGSWRKCKTDDLLSLILVWASDLSLSILMLQMWRG